MNESRIGKLPANVFLWLDPSHQTSPANTTRELQPVTLQFEGGGGGGAGVEMCGTFDLCPDCPV